MFPTDIGTVVNDFLVQHFESVLDYNFTAYVEKEFDEIAEGKLKWNKMIHEFYDPFHKTVEHTEKNSERASGERILGVDPKTGKTVLARIGRFGPLVQMNGLTEDEAPKFAKLRNDQRLENITLEQALDLFKMPRNLGEYESNEVVIGIGRFGPYVRHNSKFVSIPKTDDPYEIELARAIELIDAKRIADLEKIIKVFKEDPELKILKGRWGPYIAYGKKNIKIPKGQDPLKLTFEQCMKLEKETPDPVKGKGGRFAKKAAQPKTPVKKKAAPKKKAAAKKTKSTAKKTTSKTDDKKAPSIKKAAKKTASKKSTTTKKAAAKKTAPAKKKVATKKTTSAKAKKKKK